MNYSEISDFEINKAVAAGLGYLVKTEFEKGPCGFTEEYHRRYPNTIWAARTDDRGEQCEAWEQMNFCVFPELAWPIIKNHELSVGPHSLSDKWEARKNRTKHYGSGDYNVISDFYAQDENPLRAAMIVFLQMQQPE